LIIWRRRKTLLEEKGTSRSRVREILRKEEFPGHDSNVSKY
jgi:hypothetical protein